MLSKREGHFQDVRGEMPHSRSYVPARASVVSPEILAQVFEDAPIPFQTNPDGSVNLEVYAEWLRQAGEAALQAFEDCSEFETPQISPEPDSKVF